MPEEGASAVAPSVLTVGLRRPRVPSRMGASSPVSLGLWPSLSAGLVVRKDPPHCSGPCSHESVGSVGSQGLTWGVCWEDPERLSWHRRSGAASLGSFPVTLEVIAG